MASPDKSKSSPQLDLSGYLIDMMNLMPRDGMQPGKTYARRGAFVRKRTTSTSKKTTAKEAADEEASDNEEKAEVKKGQTRPSKGAIAAAQNAAASKKVELGPSTGLYDSSSVRERVRAWQSEGGGVVTASDIAVEFDECDNDRTRKTTQISRPISPVKERWGARKETLAKPAQDRRSPSPTKSAYNGSNTSKEAGTPRKRIISDGHWKRDRTSESKANAEDKKKQKQFDDGIRITPIPTAGLKSDKAPNRGKKLFDDGIRVYATPPMSRTTSAQDDETSAQSTNDMQEEGRITPEPSESCSAASPDATTSATEEPEPEKPVLKGKETKRSARGILGAVLQESRRMFARTEVVYVDPPENPRIDNWLGAIPDLPDDPFINEEQPEGEINLPKAKTHRRKKSKGPEIISPDPNGIWDVLSSSSTMPDSAEDLWRRQRKRRHSKANPDGDTPKKGDNDQDRMSRDHSDSEEVTPKATNRAVAGRTTMNTIDNSSDERSKKSSVGVAARQDLFSKDNRPSKSIDESSNAPTSTEAQYRPITVSPRRPFPSVGTHRLSTIASVDTLQTTTGRSVHTEASGDTSFTAKPDEGNNKTTDTRDKTALHRTRRKKTRLTRHSDLISVLSAPRSSGKSIKSARSIRTHRSRPENATIADLMKEITNDEVKYMRELRTLVDGVIPVLLASVLSKTESSDIANLFSPSGRSSLVSDTIYSMGVALESLKRWHKRLEPSVAGPVSATIFLTWAQGVHRTYKDYLKAWRMGFQDVVVNLASTSEEDSKDSLFNKGLPRNDQGDITNSDGERVDVAFLLKRPLVRLKYLAKTLKGINFVQPSTLAEKLSADYQILIEEARQRVYQEKARLEDEAAANIDATRARAVFDLRNVSEFEVIKTRRVKARDAFDLSLLHSDGQRLEGRVELFLREDLPGTGTGSDLLICQVDGNSKWLLFPPISGSDISARTGDLQDEIIVMIRGKKQDGQQWQEVLSLTSDDDQVGSEWVQMLGLLPVPPRLNRQDTFTSRRAMKSPQARKFIAESVVSDSIASTVSYSPRDRDTSPQEVLIPVGEHASSETKRNNHEWSRNRVDRARSFGKQDTIREDMFSETPRRSAPFDDQTQTCHSPPVAQDLASSSCQSRGPNSLNEAMSMAGTPNSPLKRQHATKKRPESISYGSPPRSPSRGLSQDTESPTSPDPAAQQSEQSQTSQSRPSFHRKTSSTPTTELPTVGKLRKKQPQSSKTDNAMAENRSQPNRLTKANPVEEHEDSPPPPPPHRVASPIRTTKVASPEFNVPVVKGKRLSSSPLKHQYEPSSASDDGSDTSSVSSGDTSDNDSDSSDDEDSFEMDDVLGSLPQPFPQVQPPSSQPSLPSKTLGPSSSASQAPYKTVPAQPNKALRVAATISYWSDTNQWIQLHPDICSIVVTPGLVEIYSLGPTHTYKVEHNTGFVTKQPDMPSPAAQPLLVLHLTPMVLLQQGTALDVTLRSPPQGGTLKGTFTGANFLFRSRSPEEAESLYGMFHHSRMNNPTYIALQQARAIAERPTFDSAFGREKTRTAWFSFGRQKSYRASSVPTPKAKSDPSVGTRTTSFSAKVFGNGRFNIARSSIMSRRSPDGSIYTSSDNSLESAASTPLPAAVAGDASAPLGLSNTKIRLYSREGSKWLDLGSANLTIVRPTSSADPLVSGFDLNSPPEIGYAHGVGSNGVITPTQKRSPDDKRIVVTSSKKEVPLLDVTLGDSCFERTARTGIAISLWELFEGGTVADRGGVTNGRFKYFMMQFQNEAACAFTFSIVGRHRY